MCQLHFCNANQNLVGKTLPMVHALTALVQLLVFRNITCLKMDNFFSTHKNTHLVPYCNGEKYVQISNCHH